MRLEVLGVGKNADGTKFVQLENDVRIKVSNEEYRRMYRRLSGKSKHYIDYKEVSP